TTASAASQELIDSVGIVDWLGGRDSNPDTVVQSHVSYRWTTSQYRPRRARGLESPILAKPQPQRQPPCAAGTAAGSFTSPRRSGSPASRLPRPARLRPTRPAASADGWPCRPCAPPRAPVPTSTRAPSPSAAPPCPPCWQSPAALRDPSTRIHDPLWPPSALPARTPRLRVSCSCPNRM